MTVNLRLQAGFAGLLAIVAAWPMVTVAVNHGAPSGPLTLASPVRPIKVPSQIYVVQLNEPATLNYRGTKPGYAATRPARGRRLNRRSGAVESYVTYLEDSHDRLLVDVGAPSSKLYSFRYALNGFSARLTSDQASRLSWVFRTRAGGAGPISSCVAKMSSSPSSTAASHRTTRRWQTPRNRSRAAVRRNGRRHRGWACSCAARSRGIRRPRCCSRRRWDSRVSVTPAKASVSRRVTTS